MTNWIADNLAGLVLPMPQGLPEMLPGGWFDGVLRESQHREKTADDLGLPLRGAMTPDMVFLAKAIALNLKAYSPHQREQIADHAVFCAYAADIEEADNA